MRDRVSVGGRVGASVGYGCVVVWFCALSRDLRLLCLVS